MSKYEPLAKFLGNRNEAVWQTNFSEVEKILGFTLPSSAYRYPAWWANQSGAGHSQTSGWRDAGWRTAELDLESQTICFEKAGRDFFKDKFSRNRDLWEEARKLTGISSTSELERAAVTALIQRHAARSLANMGGSMPDAKAAPRERFIP